MGSRRRGPSPLTGKRAQYLRLMQQGISNAEACRLVGVNRKTGTRWKLGRKYTNRVGETWWISRSVGAGVPLVIEPLFRSG